MNPVNKSKYFKMEELIKALKAALIKAGLKEDSTEFKNAILPENFEGIKNQLELKLPTSFDEVLKIEGFQSEFDRRQTQAVKTREDNIKDKFNLVAKGDEDPEEPKVDKATQERLDKLEKMLSEKSKGDEIAAKKETAKRLLGEKKIHESFLKQFDFNSETSIEDQLVDVEKDFNAMQQEIINKNVPSGGFPTGGVKGDASDQEVADLVDSL